MAKILQNLIPAILSGAKPKPPTVKHIPITPSVTEAATLPLVALSTAHFAGVSSGIKKTTAAPIYAHEEFNAQFGDKLVTPREFYEAIQNKRLVYATGNIPSGHDLLKQPETLKTVDKIAQALRKIDGTYRFEYSGEKPGATFVGTTEINLPELKFKNDTSDITVNKKLGTGVFGNVYEVRIGDKEYALKVFTDPNRVDVHGAIGETSYHMSTTNKGICDKAEFYCANVKDGWMLSELKKDEKKYDLAKRGSVKLGDYLEKQGFSTADFYGPNCKGNIVIDIGGIYGGRKKVKDFAEFKRQYDDPKNSMMMGRCAITEEQFNECFNHPESRAQVARATRTMHDDDLKHKLLERAMDFPESSTAAIFETTEAAPERRYELFKKALTKPEARIEAAKIIDSIPEHQRTQAFFEAWQHPECRPMLGKSLYTLQKSPDYEKMHNLVIAGDDNGARLAYLSLKEGMSGLTGEEQRLKESSLKGYFAENGLNIHQSAQEVSALPEFKPFRVLENINPKNFNKQRPVEVAPNVYRGGRPKNEEAIIELKKMGVKRLVSMIKQNKSYPDEISTWQDEAALAKKHGMDFIHISLDERIDPSLAEIQKFTAIYQEKDKYPYYFHCSAGQDRAGIMSAFNDVENLGMKFDEAYERMLDQNHDFGSYPNLDACLYRYCLSKGEKPENMHPEEILNKKFDGNMWVGGTTDTDYKQSIIGRVLEKMHS